MSVYGLMRGSSAASIRRSSSLHRLKSAQLTAAPFDDARADFVQGLSLTGPRAES